MTTKTEMALAKRDKLNKVEMVCDMSGQNKERCGHDATSSRLVPVSPFPC